ncbi:hypothetical protein CEUSTIGMA_g4142.t1 [Chlamydomonas eustigma]|uniref:Uncharacterized protein n=1 Tax=Chlamydomonas eustigma TaxID=1157962 RepID=A0A250X0W7_9CHLO|nr:hypothetical protein CEUSTIGMA_g4142.t1 [Chlamydomonas eustigma]|eukprot:GAX76696.1 hypothetical protein CEUSTIGMA_g4142.t1 [Chlamydomonas eustigma]
MILTNECGICSFASQCACQTSACTSENSISAPARNEAQGKINIRTEHRLGRDSTEYQCFLQGQAKDKALYKDSSYRSVTHENNPADDLMSRISDHSRCSTSCSSEDWPGRPIHYRVHSLDLSLCPSINSAVRSTHRTGKKALREPSEHDLKRRRGSVAHTSNPRSSEVQVTCIISEGHSQEIQNPGFHKIPATGVSGKGDSSLKFVQNMVDIREGNDDEQNPSHSICNLQMKEGLLVSSKQSVQQKHKIRANPGGVQWAKVPKEDAFQVAGPEVSQLHNVMASASTMCKGQNGHEDEQATAAWIWLPPLAAQTKAQKSQLYKLWKKAHKKN